METHPSEWVDGFAHVKGTGYLIGSRTKINASPVLVWEFLKNPNGYSSLHTSIKASVDGELCIGKKIKVCVHLMGAPISSEEEVDVLDEEKMILSWKRDVGGKMSYRPQTVYINDDGETIYSTCLFFPDNYAGWAAYNALGTAIRNAFISFGESLALHLNSP